MTAVDPAPAFSAVMATWGRGRHILPSVRSILGQSCKSFEVIVAGDACDDDTGAAVAALNDPRVRWVNLAQRIGSQSGPNNAGIAAARGRIIAYLGHDDLWEPFHLERLLSQYDVDDPPDFVMSGTLLHTPHDLPGNEVMGIFPPGTDPRQYFFPPTGFSHLRSVVERIGPWRMPGEIQAPVDDDFLRRAADAGLRFRSTGVVTAHKFSAAQRYLSYLWQGSDEQEAFLLAMSSPGHADLVAAKIAEAKASGRYMRRAKKAFETLEPGARARAIETRRGSRLAAPRPLGNGAVVRHRSELCGFDWRSAPVLGFRVGKASPCPRLLVPLLGGRARLRFLAAHRQPEALGPLHLLCNDLPVTATARRILPHVASYDAEIELRADGHSLLQFLLEGVQRPGRSGAIAIGPLRLRPA